MREMSAWMRFTPSVSPLPVSVSSSSCTCVRVMLLSGSGPHAGRRCRRIFASSFAQSLVRPFWNAT